MAEDYTVIYYDHFGNGRSVNPDDYADMTMAALAADADGLRAHLGFDEMILIGHSYGGFIAQEHATTYGDTLRGLVLVVTVPAFDYAPTVSGTDEQMAAFGALFSGPQPDNETWRANWGLVIQLYFADYDPEIGAVLDENTVYNHTAWNYSGALLASYNMIEALPGLTMPVLAMAGAEDGITPAEAGAARIADLASNSTLVVFEGAAHYPFIETEAAFFEALHSWMGDLE